MNADEDLQALVLAMIDAAAAAGDEGATPDVLAALAALAASPAELRAALAAAGL